MTTYGLIYPKLPYTEKYCDTDSLLYAMYSPEHIRVLVSRKQAELRTGNRTYTAKDLKRNDTDQYNRISEYGKMMAAFILSLRSNDVILMPDITFLGNGNEEILTNYHNAYRQGVHLKFNRGKVGNTENFSRSTVIKEKDLLELMDHLLVPLIEEMRAERLEEMAGSEINELSAEIKKN